MRLIYAALFLTVSFASFGQGFNPGMEERHPYPLRAFFNKFSINLSSGYGRTFYRHDFTDFAYVRNPQGSFLINAEDFEDGSTVSGLSNWFSDVSTRDDISLNDEYAVVPFDSIDGPLKSGGYSIPVNLLIYFNLYRLRIGGGGSLEFHQSHFPEPDDFLSAHPSPEPFNTSMRRWFFLLGYSVYEYYDNALGVDVRAGQYFPGRGFNQNVLETSPFINIGITLEKVFSEYFRLYLRPSYEIKSFNVSLPETAAQSSLQINNHAFTLTLGFSINYPDLPRSPIPNDKTQMKHVVTDSQGNRMLVRGQPFWKKQDPKIGELYPELIKSKRKRRAGFPFLQKKNKN
jgi:hypothetical protein